MARAKRLPRVHRYSLEFKLSAVRLSKLPRVQVQQVAEALDPFMLSRWRKQVRDGTLRGKAPKIELNRKLVAELKQLADLRHRYALLEQEHGSVPKQGADLCLHRSCAW